MNIPEFIERRELKWKNGSIRGPHGHSISLAKLHGDWVANLVAGEEFVPLPLFTEQIENTLRPQKSEEGEEYTFIYPTVHTPEELVLQAVEYNEFKISATGQNITQRGHSAKREDLEKYTLHHLTHYRMDSKKDGKYVRELWSVGEMQYALSVVLRESDMRTRDMLKESMVFREELSSWGDQTIDLLFSTFKTSGDPVLNREVFKQWMWQTKRWIHGLSVQDPIFLNFFGKHQHTGKTYFIRRLASPMQDYFSEVGLTADERYMEYWSTNFILFFDELSATDEGDVRGIANTMPAIKRLLTSNEVTSRQMHTTKHTTATRTASPISSSNFHLAQAIFDPTGMRRFYEIVFESKIDPAIPALIGQLDILSLWQSINHKLEKGYVHPDAPLYEKMREVQAGMKRQEPLDIAIQGDIEGEVPARIEDIPDDIRLAIPHCKNAKEVDTLLKPIKMKTIPAITLRKRYLEWIENAAGKDVGKGIPWVNNFGVGLNARGYFCIESTNPYINLRVVCWEEELGSGSSSLTSGVSV